MGIDGCRQLRAAVDGCKRQRTAEGTICTVKKNRKGRLPGRRLAIDGVDAIDPDFYSLKGGGGALFRGKIIACKARRVIWIMPAHNGSMKVFL